MLISVKNFNDFSFILPLQAAGNLRKEENKIETNNDLVGQNDKNGEIGRKLEKGVENRNQRKEQSDELLNKNLAPNARKTDEFKNLASVFKNRRLLNFHGTSLSVVVDSSLFSKFRSKKSLCCSVDVYISFILWISAALKFYTSNFFMFLSCFFFKFL